MDADVARLYAKGVDIPWVDKARAATTMPPFVRRIGKHLSALDADAFSALAGQRLNELDTIEVALDILRSIECPVVRPFVCAVLLASAHGEWGFPMMKPPFLNNDGVFDAVFPLVDSSTARTPHSKSALTPLQKERQHVAETKRVLDEALFQEQATIGPQQIGIGTGEGDSAGVNFGLVYLRTECEETKATGSMTFVLRKQLWAIEALLPADVTLMLFPPSIEKISERVNDIFEKSTVTFVSAMLVRVEGISIPQDRVLASPARFFFEGTEEHIIPKGNFSLVSYHEAQRRKLADGSNVVLIQLNPWSAKPNDFATRVFHTPDEDEETKHGTEEIIVGDVLAVPECSLATCVKEHLGLKEPKSPLNIRLRVYEQVLLLAQESQMTDEVAPRVKTLVNNDGGLLPEECSGLNLLPKVMYTKQYD